MSDDNKKKLSPDDTAAALEGSTFMHLRGALHASYTTPDFASAAELVARAGAAADAANHHPEITLTWGSARFVLTSHDAGGVTLRDVELAAQLERIADELGAVADSSTPLNCDIGIDTVNADGIRPFWKAAFGYDEQQDLGDDGIDLVDPRGVGPRIWFQTMDPPREDRNRIHFDIFVPMAQVRGRVDAVLAAGGHLMTDEFAPDWWVIADAEGNEVCICTSTR